MNSHPSAGFRVAKILATLTLVTIGCASARAQLTLLANFTTPDTTDFPGSTPMANAASASTIEATIDQALTQVSSLISYSGTFEINFLSDPNTSLGASVGTGSIELPYSTYLSDIEAEPNKSTVLSAGISGLPAGPGTGINNNATQLLIGGALLDAIGDTTDGNSLISDNNGLAGTVALNMTQMNISRTDYNTSDYDLVSTVTHEVDEILGIGGAGSTLGSSGTDIGVMDLYRYSAPGVRSYSTSANVSSYFSINGGNTDLVHFNQDSGGDYADWGDGATPADGQGNNPPQVQDAFGDTTAEPNMGPNEATALNVVGWQMTAAGLALEAIPEPGMIPSMLVAGGILVVGLRRSRRSAV